MPRHCISRSASGGRIEPRQRLQRDEDLQDAGADGGSKQTTGGAMGYLAMLFWLWVGFFGGIAVMSLMAMAGDDP
jgi:hypothetical protein